MLNFQTHATLGQHYIKLGNGEAVDPLHPLNVKISRLVSHWDSTIIKTIPIDTGFLCNYGGVGLKQHCTLNQSNSWY